MTLSAEFYDALIETLDVFGDEGAREKLLQGLRELEQGRAVSWATVRKELAG